MHNLLVENIEHKCIFYITEYNYIYGKTINLSRGTAFPTRLHVRQAITQISLHKSFVLALYR